MMKVGLKVISRFAIGAISVFVFATSFRTDAQVALAPNPQAPPRPSEEKFIPSNELISPWRNSDCAETTRPYEGTCTGTRGYKYKNAFNLVIYDHDGTKWYDLDLNTSSPKYWWSDSQVVFIPFASTPKEYPVEFVLRLVSQSQHWYEVEINESTKATKYILRSDPLWSPTTWEGWLYRGIVFSLSEKHSTLLDQPNGEPIVKPDWLKLDRVRIDKVEGDWAFVKATGSSQISHLKIQGWIRWRNGRDILVGCYFNNFKAP